MNLYSEHDHEPEKRGAKGQEKQEQMSLIHIVTQFPNRKALHSEVFSCSWFRCNYTMSSRDKHVEVQGIIL